MRSASAGSWQTYLVGGAVRDRLLDLPVVERDWVVVGATPQQMTDAGFVPVDAEFPVFRDPHSGEEYALARRETKHGEGYRGFVVDAAPDVSLDEDLSRRDLTINAIAQADDGTLIDPYGGRDDLAAGLLRHVTTAFDEDPLRVLRVARFAAKLGRFGFRVAHDTHRLMCEMAARGDLAHLAAERVWREMLKAMATDQPWRFFEVLQRCGALDALLPLVARTMGVAPAHAASADSPALLALRHACDSSDTAPVRLAAVLVACLGADDDVERELTALRADRDTTQLVRRAWAARDIAEHARRPDPAALHELLARWRAWDGATDLDGSIAVLDAQYETPRLQRIVPVAAAAARAVSAASLSDSGLSGAILGARLAELRRAAIASALEDAALLT